MSGDLWMGVTFKKNTTRSVNAYLLKYIEMNLQNFKDNKLLYIIVAQYLININFEIN